eukprot:130417-Prymnesium_polylepis.1
MLCLSPHVLHRCRQHRPRAKDAVPRGRVLALHALHGGNQIIGSGKHDEGVEWHALHQRRPLAHHDDTAKQRCARARVTRARVSRWASHQGHVAAVSRQDRVEEPCGL